MTVWAIEMTVWVLNVNPGLLPKLLTKLDTDSMHDHVHLLLPALT